ncbi:hypothetical protein PRNP1_001418 [Phytophthora ramorum]
MWTRFGLVCLLLGAPLISADRAAHYKMMVSTEAAASSGSSATSGTISAASAATSSTSGSGGWHMKAVTSVQARVQGDAPVWNDEAQLWLSKYGDTTELAYMNNLDTVNTASVEGALMYVQAEGINVNEQSVKCERKNSMQYVVFYELTIVQPTYGIKYYESHTPPEYGEFVAMDVCSSSGCDAATSSFSFPDLTLPANSSSSSSSDSSTDSSTDASTSTSDAGGDSSNEGAQALSDDSSSGSSSAVTVTTASAVVALVTLVASSLL